MLVSANRHVTTAITISLNCVERKRDKQGGCEGILSRRIERQRERDRDKETETDGWIETERKTKR